MKSTDFKECPVCGGDGINVTSRIEPRCCMNFDQYGGCCNCPEPDQVLDVEQCQLCEATGKIIDYKN